MILSRNPTVELPSLFIIPKFRFHDRFSTPFGNVFRRYKLNFVTNQGIGNDMKTLIIRGLVYQMFMDGSTRLQT